jgi:hypothetical protein
MSWAMRGTFQLTFILLPIALLLSACSDGKPIIQQNTELPAISSLAVVITSIDQTATVMGSCDQIGKIGKGFEVYFPSKGWVEPDASAECVDNVFRITVPKLGREMEFDELQPQTKGLRVRRTTVVGLVAEISVDVEYRPDITPNLFKFTDRGRLKTSTWIDSNIVQINGIGISTLVSVTGSSALFRICSDAACSTNPAFGSTSSRIENDQYLQVRARTASSVNQTVVTTVSVGPLNSSWSLATGANFAAISGFAEGGEVMKGGRFIMRGAVSSAQKETGQSLKGGRFEMVLSRDEP